MKLLNSDSMALAIGGFIIVTFSLLFYFDITKRIGPGSEEVIGEVLFKMNTAQRKYASQVVWEPITTKATLYNYDTLRTSDLSEAVIKLKDGTEITMNENSMILLSLSTEQFDIKFLGGAITAKREEDKENEIKNVNITSGDSTITIADSDVSVTENMDKNLNVTVNRGTAQLNIGEENKVIEQNQSVVASDEGLRLYNLTIKLIAPENNSYLPITKTDMPVTFSWEKLEGKYETVVEIARDFSFGETFRNVKGAGNTAFLNLPEGVYYWRVMARNLVNKKMEYSETRKLAVISNRPVQLISPVQNSVIRYKDKRPMISYLWSRNESARGYRLIISSNNDMSNPKVNIEVLDNSISLDSLDEGTYYWRVANMLEVEGQSAGEESATGKFMVTRTDRLEPPSPTYPPEGKSISRLIMQKKGIVFSWDKKSEIPAVRIVIARDKAFKNIAYDRTVEENMLKLGEAFDEGTLYWRLIGIMNDEEITDPSLPRSFIVVTGGHLKLISPTDGEVMTNEAGGGGTRINFIWADAELEGDYMLQLARNRNIDSPLKEIKIKDLSYRIEDLKDGKYYWRVKLMDEKGEKMLDSPIFSFDILSVLEKPVALSPIGGSTINMAKSESLDFKWKGVKGATFYRIGLYQLKSGIQQAVMNTETGDSSFKFTDLKKLDEGKFLWTIQAVEMSQNRKKLRRKSEEVNITFNITSGISDKKIEIKTPDVLYIE